MISAAPCSDLALPVGVNATSDCDEIGGVKRCNVSCASGFFGNFEGDEISVVEYTCVNDEWVSSSGLYDDAKLYCVGKYDK